jgi:hypothetical protein
LQEEKESHDEGEPLQLNKMGRIERAIYLVACSQSCFASYYCPIKEIPVQILGVMQYVNEARVVLAFPAEKHAAPEALAQMFLTGKV